MISKMEESNTMNAHRSAPRTLIALAGIVALMLWALLASISLLFGGAIGAQLEAVRGGRPAPQDAAKSAPIP